MPIYIVQDDRVGAEVLKVLRIRFAFALATLAITIAVSTIGFTILANDHVDEMTFPNRVFLGLWETLNIVSTVGAIGELTQAEKAWSILVIIFGLGAVLYGFGSLQAMLHRGELLGLIVRRRMQQKIEQLNDHIIIAGYGHVGMAAAAELKRHNASVIVIDNDDEAVTLADENGLFVIKADATDEEVLHKAGVERATGLIATLNSDAANVYLILMAKEMHPNVRIVARAERHETRGRLLRAGADQAIVPGELAAQKLSHLMLKPTVSESMISATGDSDYDFAQIQVSDHPHLAGKSLSDLDLPKKADVIVISIISGKGEQEFNPRAQRQLSNSDTLLVVCREDGLERIAALS